MMSNSLADPKLGGFGLYIGTHHIGLLLPFIMSSGVDFRVVG